MPIIMVVPTWGKRCGTSNYSRSLALALRELGCEATVASDDGMGLLSLSDGIRPALVHFQHGYMFYEPRRLGGLLRSLRNAGIPSIATLHEVSPAFPEHNAVIPEFDGIIVHSEAMRLGLARFGVESRPTYLIPMGCTVYRPGDRSVTRLALGLGRGPAVGFFGFMLPHKGIVQLLGAISILRRGFSGIRCFVFSTPAPYTSSRSYREEVERALVTYDLRGAATVCEEYLDEEALVNFLHAMDVNVLPYRERAAVGASSAVRTVMAAGRPAITTDVSFFSEFEREVYKIRSDEPEDIAEAIRYLLSEPGAGERLVEAARDYLLANTWQETARRHMEVYSSICRLARKR